MAAMNVRQSVAAGGKVAVVTGAGRGIGRAIAFALSSAGFRVACVSREDMPAEGLPPQAHYYRHDVAEIAGHEALLDRIAGEMGEPDCLVNNAGVTSQSRGDLLELTPESFDTTLGINLRAGFFLSQAFGRRIVKSTGSSHRSLIFIGSVNAEIIGENRADYCISKAGVSMMAKLFASRLAHMGVAVFEVRPGIIRTDMTSPASARYDALLERGGVPMARWGMPEDVGQAVAALATGTIPYATGIHVDVAGGMQMYRV